MGDRFDVWPATPTSCRQGRWCFGKTPMQAERYDRELKDVFAVQG
jgi:hypothetical protein